MDDYGLITIDNRNLLDDLLGLSEQNENPSQLISNQQYDYMRSKLPNNNTFYPESRKVYLESPTFTKREDDIYRYVHSRLSSVDQTTTNKNNLINESLNDFNENQNFSFNNEKISNKLRIKNAQLLPQPLLNRNTNNNNNIISNTNTINNNNNNNISNRLLSDFAVASLPKNNINSIQNSRGNLDDPLYDNELLDSLDNTNNNNFYTNNYSNQFNNNNYNNNQASFNYQDEQHQQQPFVLNNQSQANYIQQQQLPKYQQSQQQQIQIVPFQNGPKPGSVFTILPSPTTGANPLPIVQSSLQFQPTAPAPQFFPITLQPAQYLPAQPAQAPQNMFVQEPLQPMFYNPAYPINLNGPIQNPTNFYNKPSDYDQYQFQADFYNNNQPNYHHHQSTNINGNKYDAQPLQPPPQMGITPRQLNNTNHVNSNTKKKINQSEIMNNNSEDYDSPDSDENNDLNNEFNSMRVYEKNPHANSNNNNDISDEEQKKAEVWNKLQNANRKLDSKGNVSQNKGSGLPPVTSTKSVLKQKPPLEKRESNFIEKNVESIKNKENLTHRYPEKKYETFYGKNLTNRVKYFQGNDKVKPPHQLQPIENYNAEDYKAVSLDISNQDDLYSTKKISIPINPNALKNKDHINLDINLRLLDFLPNPNSRNRSFDDFEVNDPLNQHIKRFESISRSLPGSSGSLNKHKPLPPVNRRVLTTNPSEDHEMRYEDGYLAQLQKAQNRPVIKTYTLKDYRNFKKDAIPNTSTNTGKLGHDFENESYKQKVEIAQKKIDYAERVKARNKILLTEKKNDENESINTVSHQSKTQRAKEYVRTHVIRPRSGSRSNSNDLDTDAHSQTKYISSDRSYRGESVQNFKNGKNAKLDMNSKQRSLDRAIVRIRDPVTSKIRTLYLNDNELDQQLERHEQDKNKVSSLLNGVGGGTNRSNSNNSNTNGKNENINGNGVNNTNLNSSSYNLGSNSLINSSLHSNHGIILKSTKKPVDLERSKIMEEYDKQLKEEDEEFQKLMERHNAEKSKVNEFEASPYLQENLIINNTENQIQ